MSTRRNIFRFALSLFSYTLLTTHHALASSATADDAWRAGVAEVVITPAKPMWMSGYAARDHRVEGTLHDLYVKTLVLESPDKSRVALLTLDLVGIDRGTSGEICEQLRTKYDLARRQVAINCSHTHCGPVAGVTLRSMYVLEKEDQELVAEYTESLTQKVVECVGKALDDLAPARVSWGNGTCDFAVNRRENKADDVPQLRASNMLKGPSDHDVPVLAVHDAGGKLRAVAFGYACHATTLSFYQWCGDYPGFAYRALEERHPGAVGLFWAGCGADQNPLPRRTVELAEQYGKQLADSVDAVLAADMRPCTGAIAASYAEVTLDFQHAPTKDELEASVKSGNKYEQGRARMFLDGLAAGRPVPTNWPYPVQTWKLGDGPQWVLLGGEVVVDYALRLKHELGRETTWVAGYTNDVMAYIPSRRVLAEGGYEGASSMIYYGRPSPWAPMLEEAIVGAVRENVAR